MEWQNYPEFFLGMSEARLAEARPYLARYSGVGLVCAVNLDFAFLNKFLS